MGCPMESWSRGSVLLGLMFGFNHQLKLNKMTQLCMSTDCIYPSHHTKPLHEVLVEMTDGGLDYALECIGSPMVMEDAGESPTEDGGTCVITGWTEKERMDPRPEGPYGAHYEVDLLWRPEECSGGA